MKYTSDSQITNIDEVRDFFNYLICDLKINIHPDNDFSDYVKIGTNEPSFAKDEIVVYNKLMDKCFEICKKEDIDIYELCLPILQKATLGE